jgi:hypothetical protein
MRKAWNDGGDSMVLCFAQTAFTVHGGISMLSSHITSEDTHCPKSPIILGLADMVLSRVDGGGAFPSSHAVALRSERRLRVLLLVRGGSKTNDKSRQLSNRERLRDGAMCHPFFIILFGFSFF